MECLTLQDHLRDGDLFGIHRTFFTSRSLGRPHTHDFIELWWVEAGGGTHQVNGTAVAMQSGDLVLMRAADAHCMGQGEFTVTNIFFPCRILAHIQARYFAAEADFWGGAAPVPPVHRLTAAHVQTLRQEAERLAQMPKTLLQIERFLLNLLDLLAASELPALPPGLPAWLQSACRQIREPDFLRRGTPAFIALTGKSPEHVCRVVRQWLHTTPHQLVTEARMAYAARQLEMTSRPIIEIAYECGYDSLSRFYRVFTDTYGLPPRAYRRRLLQG
jgi:AraC-like DNA-binding protein